MYENFCLGGNYGTNLIKYFKFRCRNLKYKRIYKIENSRGGWYGKGSYGYSAKSPGSGSDNVGS